MALLRARRPSVDDSPTTSDTPQEFSSRRARRDAEAAVAAAAKAARPDPKPWIARGAVLVALAGMTIVVPATGFAMPGGESSVVRVVEATYAPGELPSTVDALSAVPGSEDAPATIALSTGVDRNLILAVSRADERGPIPGCEPGARPAGSNGQLDTADLCNLPWNSRIQLRADAALALADLNAAFRVRFGEDLRITDGYRTIGSQSRLRALRGSLAAPPGRSNHGWGLAIDLNRSETVGEKWVWLNENGPVYGWVNPEWARPGGRGPREPWHWEYLPAVKSDGEYYGRD